MDQQPHQQGPPLQANQQWQHYDVAQNEMRFPPQHPGVQSSGHPEAGPWRGQSDDPGQQHSGPGAPPPPPPSETGRGPQPSQQGHPEQQGWGQVHGTYIESGPPGVPDQQELWPQEQEPAPPGSGPEPGPPPHNVEPPPPGQPFGMLQGNMGHEQVPTNAPPPPPPPPPPGEPESWNRPPAPPDSGMHGFQPPPPPPPPDHQSLPTPVQLPAPIQLPPPQTLPAPHPPSPLTLPAPQPLPPGQQQTAPLPPPQGQEAPMPQQGELTQEQYNALTPEQQAEYWNQWHHYSQYYNLQQQQQQPAYPGYEGYVDPQYQLYQQQQYQQYGVPQPGWEQYAQQPAYQQQMPPEAYMQAQQGYAPPPGQMPYGQIMQPQAAAPMAPFASMPLQGMPGAGYPGPGQAPATHGMEGRASGAPLFPTGLGLQMPAQPKKPAVPEWLRAEMLKRGLSADGAGAPKKQLSDSDDESEPAAKQRRKFSDAGPGTRWQGPAGGRGRRGSDDESDSEAEEEARMMRINNEVKRQLTQLLLAVTDRMFEEVAEEVYSAASAPVKRPVPVSGAVVLMTEDGSDGPSGDVLGLGYGTDSDDEESKQNAAPAAAAKDETAEAAAAKPEAVIKSEEAAGASIKQDESPGVKAGPSQGASETSVKPEPKSEGVSSEPSFPKGSRVWYVDRGGSRIAATVEAVDTSHPPPSYTIRLDGAPQTRSTEGNRLRLMEGVKTSANAGAGMKEEEGKDGGAGLASKGADPGLETKPPEPLAAGLEEKASTSQQEAEGADRKRDVSAVKETGKSKANGKTEKDRGAGKEERDKSKDKDKASLKRKESDRERDKEKEKERQRAKDKERAREREKERERERQREKAKEREREERERAHAQQRDRDRRRKRGSSSSPGQSPSEERELDRRDSKRGRYGRSRSRSRDRRSRSSSRPRQRRASPKPGRRHRSRSDSPARRKGKARSPSPASPSPPKVGKSKTGKDSKSTKKDVQKSRK